MLWSQFLLRALEIYQANKAAEVASKLGAVPLIGPLLETAASLVTTGSRADLIAELTAFAETVTPENIPAYPAVAEKLATVIATAQLDDNSGLKVIIDWTAIFAYFDYGEMILADLVSDLVEKERLYQGRGYITTQQSSKFKIQQSLVPLLVEMRSLACDKVESAGANAATLAGLEAALESERAEKLRLATLLLEASNTLGASQPNLREEIERVNVELAKRKVELETAHARASELTAQLSDVSSDVKKLRDEREAMLTDKAAAEANASTRLEEVERAYRLSLISARQDLEQKGQAAVETAIVNAEKERNAAMIQLQAEQAKVAADFSAQMEEHRTLISAAEDEVSAMRSERAALIDEHAYQKGMSTFVQMELRDQRDALLDALVEIGRRVYGKDFYKAVVNHYRVNLVLQEHHDWILAYAPPEEEKDCAIQGELRLNGIGYKHLQSMVEMLYDKAMQIFGYMFSTTEFHPEIEAGRAFTAKCEEVTQVLSAIIPGSETECGEDKLLTFLGTVNTYCKGATGQLSQIAAAPNILADGTIPENKSTIGDTDYVKGWREFVDNHLRLFMLEIYTRAKFFMKLHEEYSQLQYRCYAERPAEAYEWVVAAKKHFEAKAREHYEGGLRANEMVAGSNTGVISTITIDPHGHPIIATLAADNGASASTSGVGIAGVGYAPHC